MPGLADLGIDPTPVEVVAPSYLEAFRLWQRPGVSRG